MTYNKLGEDDIFAALIELAKEYGLLVAILSIMAVFFMRKADKANERHIQTLQDEVERVVKERDKSQDFILSNRLSSGDPRNGGEDA